MKRRHVCALSFATVFLLQARLAVAQEPAPEEKTPDAQEPTTDTPSPDANPKVLPADAPKRKTDITPVPAQTPPATQKVKFTADPIADGAILAIGATFGILSSQILSTDEIRPQQISPTFDSKRLLWLDRPAVRQTVDPAAGTLSNIGLWGSVGYAVLDSTLDVFREGQSAALVDTIMYMEAFIVTQGLTNISKIAFRRPRPRAYIERDNFIRGGGDPAAYDNSSVDSSLSFVSGHASQTAAMSAAATYIAFSRSPRTARPWLTLAGGIAVTTFVGYERVRAAAHFPTDVIAGAAVGAGVGALVVHFHREDSVRQRPVWIGVAPVLEGGMISASGIF